jgi:serine/threonine protein kinase
LPPSIIDGRYRVLGLLGAGAMGVVYRAEDVVLDRPVALKVIEPSLANTPAAAKSLLREARALARLRHDNVVQVYSFGSFDERFYFAMEYVAGESLEALIERHSAAGKRVPIVTALEIVTRVASGLSAAHAQNIVHRDVKPSNIVVEHATRRPVLIDFGIAREVEAANPRSSLVLAGTPSYMAPEQARNDHAAIGHKVDVYALACTAFELLTARPVFEGDDMYTLMHAHVSASPPPISAFRPEYAAFDPVFARALAKKPRYRQETCDELARELGRAARDAGLIGASGTMVVPVPRNLPPAESVTDATPSSSRAAVRVLVLAADDWLRRTVVRHATLSLQQISAATYVECTTEPSALVESFGRDPAQVVIVDDERASGASLEIAHRLRAMTGGPAVRLLVITRDMLSDREPWQAAGVRRVAKPLNTRALTTVLEEIAATFRPHD